MALSFPNKSRAFDATRRAVRFFLPEVKKRMEDIAVETTKSSPEELATLTRADADKWGKIIKQLGIAPQ